jgi:hypothetical protein
MHATLPACPLYRIGKLPEYRKHPEYKIENDPVLRIV